MLKLRGRHAKTEWKKLLFADQAVIELEAHGSKQQIAVVAAYQHMGAMIASD